MRALGPGLMLMTVMVMAMVMVMMMAMYRKHLVKQVGYVNVNVKVSTYFSLLLAKASTNSEFNGPKDSCGNATPEGTTGSRSGAPPSSRPARGRRGLRGCHTLSRVNTV